MIYSLGPISPARDYRAPMLYKYIMALLNNYWFISTFQQSDSCFFVYIHRIYCLYVSPGFAFMKFDIFAIFAHFVIIFPLDNQ